MRILFMGTPEFAVESLKALFDAGHCICGAFTRPEAPKGRGMKLAATPVQEFAAANGIPVYQPTKLRDGSALEIIKGLSPDLIAVVAYGRLLPPDFLSFPPLGCVNVHASLLPKFRGASPINWAVASGEKRTGVTTMYMAEEMDTGDIIMQKSTPIGERETAGQLHDRLMQMGAVLLLKTVDLLARSAAKAKPQDHSKATYAPPITKADAIIDCEKTARQVDCLIRGMSPKPGARLGSLIIHKAEPIENANGNQASPITQQPSTTYNQPPTTNHQLSIVNCQLSIGSLLPGGILVCGGGSFLRLLEVQAPGGRRMGYLEYERGLRA